MAFERVWHKAYAPGVPAEINFEKITMPEVLARTAKKFPDKGAIFYEGRRITYREMDKYVNQVARAMKKLGVNKGDKVAFLLPNIPNTLIGCYGVLRIGAITVMNNPLYTERELEYQLNDTGVTIIITIDEALPKVLSLTNKTKITTIVTCGYNDFLPSTVGEEKASDPLPSNVYRFMEIMNACSDDPVENEPKWDDVANIIFTGGTTGVSKGVMLTHSNLSSNSQQYSVWLQGTVDGEERWLVLYPLFHSAGYMMASKAIYTGWETSFIPKPSPEAITKVIEITRPSFLPGVSTIFVGLLNNEKFQSMDISYIKGYLTGGGPLTVETLKQLKRKRNAPVINVYGLTETTPCATATPWGADEKPGTVGVPYPNTDMKIVHIEDKKREMPVGEPGEIALKGPQVMKGYLNKPEETDNVLIDGWLYTGDIGFVDEDGYLTIVDRKKDLIVCSGFNVYPKEIDELLYAHPKVLEACTIGIPHEYRGETVKCYVVLKKGESSDEASLIEYCREHLAPYKIPKIIEFVEEIPKSTVGKILRRELRELDKKKK
jgi:long-chain acyl-CoA synthetase